MKINKKVALTIFSLLFSIRLFAVTIPESLLNNSASQPVSDDVDSVIPNPQLAMSVSNYPVTAGDVYTVAFAAGTTAVSYSIPVDFSYKIRIANLGVINCQNMTFLELKEAVTNLVQKNYPMGGVQFVLTAPASFLVTVTGEVKESKEKNAWALTRLSSVIKDSFTNYSSERNITIESKYGTKKTYDLFSAKKDGDLTQDPYLRPGDKIIVNRAERMVSIRGSVERPKTYELLQGENIKDLINKYASGLTENADLSRVSVVRTVNENKEFSGKKETMFITQKEISEDMALFDRDVVTISSINDIQNVLYIEGSLSVPDVTNPTVNVDSKDSMRIAVNFTTGENYETVIRNNKNKISTSADLQNAYIKRTINNSDGTFNEQKIPLNVAKILYDVDYVSPVELQNFDVLVIPFNQYYVTVTGAVISPGRYAYIPDKTWKYYVDLAGGIDEDKNDNDAIEIKTADGKVLGKEDCILPETNIKILKNSKLYSWDKISAAIIAACSILSTIVTIVGVFL